MGLFGMMEERGHEQLIFCYNQPTDLKAIIAIHDTTLGKAVGGCRLWRYDTEKDAIADALILSEIMTYQSSISDCDTGGGKVVLWHDFEEEPDEAYYRALGRFIEGLKGRIVTYPDLGTDSQEMRYIRRETEHVLFYETASGLRAESSELTAYGVYWGMKACVKELYGVSSLDGLTVGIQGVGSVGQILADYLKQENVKLVVTDLNYDSIKKVQDRYPDTIILKPEEILACECEIFSPCALGPVFTRENIDKLNCKIIAGGAYNVLEDAHLAEELYKQGIIYAPDFVINSGELFLTADALQILSKEEALARVKKIYDIMAKVLSISKRENISPYLAAYRMANERIKRVGDIKNILCCI
jgi:leucine dehydrogenase